MSNEINVKVNGIALRADAGLRLSEIISGEKPCGGHGKCGKCKIIVKSGEVSPVTDSERALLGEDEIARGVRLSCLTCAVGDCEIENFYGNKCAQIVTDGVSVDTSLKPEFTKYGVAVDIGTTTIASRLYNNRGELLCSAARLNPQSEWGADVVSRIESALKGNVDALAKSVRGAIDGLISELADSAKVDCGEIDGAVITGNTVMLCLLTKESVEPLSHAPFEAKRLFGESFSASELELSSLKPHVNVYLPYCMSAFVGADITCAVIATDLYKKESALLVDIGTNGEMALWNGSSLSTCSTAAGPAFEGVGISMGMRGEAGAIDKVWISDGELSTHVIGEGEAVGICGSGLVDAVACMLENETVDETGFMEDDAVIVIDPVLLTQNDIRMVQLAKSAICAGMQTLVSEENIAVSDLDTVYVAGGFGNYLNMENAEKIGLLPEGVTEKTVNVGNAALAGASMLLLNSDLRETSKKLAAAAKTLELSTHKLFSDLYINGMFF